MSENRSHWTGLVMSTTVISLLSFLDQRWWLPLYHDNWNVNFDISSWRRIPKNITRHKSLFKLIYYGPFLKVAIHLLSLLTSLLVMPDRGLSRFSTKSSKTDLVFFSFEILHIAFPSSTLRSTWYFSIIGLICSEKNSQISLACGLCSGHNSEIWKGKHHVS